MIEFKSKDFSFNSKYFNKILVPTIIGLLVSLVIIGIILIRLIQGEFNWNLLSGLIIVYSTRICLYRLYKQYYDYSEVDTTLKFNAADIELECKGLIDHLKTPFNKVYNIRYGTIREINLSKDTNEILIRCKFAVTYIYSESDRSKYDELSEGDFVIYIDDLVKAESIIEILEQKTGLKTSIFITEGDNSK